MNTNTSVGSATGTDLDLDKLGGAIKMAVNMLTRDNTPVRIEAAGALLAAFGEVADRRAPQPSADRAPDSWRDCDDCDGSGRISSAELCACCNESGIVPGADRAPADGAPLVTRESAQAAIEYVVMHNGQRAANARAMLITAPTAAPADGAGELDKLPRYNGASIAHVAAWKFKEFVELDDVRKLLADRAPTAGDSPSPQPGVDEASDSVVPGVPDECAGQLRVAADLCERNDHLTCASTLRAIADVMKAGRAALTRRAPPAFDAKASDARYSEGYSDGWREGRADLTEATTASASEHQCWSEYVPCEKCGRTGWHVCRTGQQGAAQDVQSKSKDVQSEGAAQAQAGEEAEASYQIREIGEGGWESVTRERMEAVRDDPHWDFRMVWPASLAAPAQRNGSDQ